MFLLMCYCLNDFIMILGDISAEELFNMFFGAGFQTGTGLPLCSSFVLTVF